MYHVQEYKRSVFSNRGPQGQGRRKGGAQGRPRPSCLFSRGAGVAKVPFCGVCLFKNEQALAEVILCVKAESGVIARTEILRLYLLQA